MTPLRTTILSATVLICSASFALSDQFIIQLDAPLVGNDVELRQSLKLVEVDAFEYDEKQFVVFEADGDDYIKAYFKAKHVRPVTVMVLPQKWSDTNLGAVSIGTKVEILTPIACDFCSI